MFSMKREVVLLILQYLDAENFKETLRKLEKESGVFFNMRYFEDAVTNGEWDEVEKYLSGFTKVDDNRHSTKIFFDIRRQSYLEALDEHDHAKSVKILKEMKVFSTYNEDLFKEIALLLTLDNFRENENLANQLDTKSARATILVELKKLIEANPVFKDKLQFPSSNDSHSRLQTLINQSFRWQHKHCMYPRPNPEIETLFVDHTCGQPNGPRTPSPVTNPLAGSMPKVGGFPPLGVLGAHGTFQPAPAGFTAPPARWTANPSAVPHQTVSAGPMSLTAASNPAFTVKRPRSPTDDLTMDYQTTDVDVVLKRSRPSGISAQVNNMHVNILPVTYPGQSQTPTCSPDDLPKTVVAKLNQGSSVKSMDFNPLQHSLLLVGTNIGDVSIWEVGSKERLVYRTFKVRDLSRCSVTLQDSLATKYTATVNRVMWSPDGSCFGVAYSKHIVHIFFYNGGTELGNHLEIEAHAGNVNDLAFAQRSKQLCVVTCGEDKCIKVWDAASGAKLHAFVGHEAAVYSVCPQQKEIPFIFSTAVDGKIKVWLYDNRGCVVDYDSPGRSCTTMAYTADRKRLFSCGTNKEGESFLVEWNESEGAVKQTYLGLGKRSVGVVQFDTTRNKFLAAGDEFAIKFWDMDNVNVLATIDAEGGLSASPCIRFNKGGMLLAVSTKDNGIKVLANPDGVRLVRSIDSRKFDSSRVAFGSTMKNDDHRGSPDIKPQLEKPKTWKPTEINEPSQLRSLRLPDFMLAVRIMRLMYTNSGGALLALAYNAVHKLWKWQRNGHRAAGKATTDVAPQLWTPSSGIVMTNEIGEANTDEVVPCFALSKNDSYVLSTSGGIISLFNMMTFKTMTTFMPHPPAATSLAFHPHDNNIVAIGMDDSTIRIHNVRVDEVIYKLKGHNKRVTGLAFSNVLDVLVSIGADSQLCVWSIDRWDIEANTFLQMPTGRTPNPLAHARVQFHHDQIHVLAVLETQVAIYEVPKLEGLKQWFPRVSSGAITDATYSCDSQLIYVSFKDGSVGILVAATLSLRCMINPSAYCSPNPSNKAYPVSLAAHPSEPNQFAIGLTDGGVHVLEPLESESKWGILDPSTIVKVPSDSDLESR